MFLSASNIHTVNISAIFSPEVLVAKLNPVLDIWINSFNLSFLTILIVHTVDFSVAWGKSLGFVYKTGKRGNFV